MYAKADKCWLNLLKIDEFAKWIKDCRFTHHSTANCSLKSIQECSSRSEVKGAPIAKHFWCYENFWSVKFFEKNNTWQWCASVKNFLNNFLSKMRFDWYHRAWRCKIFDKFLDKVHLFVKNFREFNPHWSAFAYTLNLGSTRKLLFWVQWVISCRMRCISVPFYLLFRI